MSGFYGCGIDWGDLVEFRGRQYIAGEGGITTRTCRKLFDLYELDGKTPVFDLIDSDELKLLKTARELRWERQRGWAP